MNRDLLLSGACFLADCNSCQLDRFDCDCADTDILLEQARKHYAEMKKSRGWERYNNHMMELYGEHYEKELILHKTKVV